MEAPVEVALLYGADRRRLPAASVIHEEMYGAVVCGQRGSQSGARGVPIGEVAHHRMHEPLSRLLTERVSIKHSGNHRVH